MLRLLDNFFDDEHEERPRLLLFPTETVAENFYRELASKPNRYRDWLREQPNLPPWPESDDDEDAQPRTVADVVRREDARHKYVTEIRERLGGWPKNVGAFKGTGTHPFRNGKGTRV